MRDVLRRDRGDKPGQDRKEVNDFLERVGRKSVYSLGLS